jgi:hypothetical protein
MRTTQAIPRGLALLLACALVGACAATPSASATSSAPPTATATGAPTSARPAPSAGAGSSAAAVTPLRTGCDPCNLDAGTYVTSGQAAFLRGLQVTVPTGWFSDEQDAGEFNLHPVGQPDDSIFFWKDLSATPNDQTGTQLAGVSGTATGLVSWLTSNPDLVVSKPRPAMIGQVPMVIVDVRVSRTAKTPKNSDCHADPCVWFLRDMKHWDHPFDIAKGDIARFYFGTIGQASDPHTFAVEIEGRGFDAPALDTFTERVGLILDSVVIPDVIVDY